MLTNTGYYPYIDIQLFYLLRNDKEL
jgi:hypothetical protein